MQIDALQHNVEFSGQLAEQLHQGQRKQFDWWLSVMLDDILAQPRIADDELAAPDDALAHLNPGPRAPLGVREEDWRQQEWAGQLARQTQLSSVRLWQAMHPEPLSMHNDPKHIDDEVIANLSYSAQQRLSKGKEASSAIEADPTALYDILQEQQAGQGISAAA